MVLFYISFSLSLLALTVGFRASKLEHYPFFSVLDCGLSSLKKMRKQSFKTIKLFIKFILLFQLYSNIDFEAEATQNPITKSRDESDGACLNDRTPENKMVDSDLDRPKRPARLLPLRMIL